MGRFKVDVDEVKNRFDRCWELLRDWVHENGEFGSRAEGLGVCLAQPGGLGEVLMRFL